jgi:hypothetical protein
MRQVNSFILMIVFVVPALGVAAVLTSETQTNTDIPSELGNPSLAALGFVDVTADPFSADPRGKRDSTEALQRAIVFARDHQMVCFFPPGEYKVSDTLNCEQYCPLRRDGRRQGTRDYPCVLLGSRRAEKRPRIVLAPHSAGYSNPENHALFIVERTPNFLLANLVDSPRMPQGMPNTYFTGDGVDPRRWHMVRESTAAGETILTPPLDRPVLYKRGHVSQVPGRAEAGGGVSATQIKPYSRNPGYWEYRGKPLLLIGGSDQDNIFQWVGAGTMLTDHLDLLQACGGNYIRCTMSSRSYTEDGYHWNVYPYPFARVDGKYDLKQWNPVYWNKLRMFLRETKNRGIIVQLEFWDRWNECGDSTRSGNGWYDSPWNPNNNVNYDWSNTPLLKPGRTDFYNAFHYAALENDPILLPLQQRFIRKIIDTVIDGGFDHVIYQVDNESGVGDGSLEPDPYWARFACAYARSKGRDELYICTQRRFHKPNPYKSDTFQDWENPEIRIPILNDVFNYCDISQNNGVVGQQHYDNILWFRARVLEHSARPINNVKAYRFDWPIGGEYHKRTPGTDPEAAARLWRAVFAGAASFRFHRMTKFARDGMYPGLGLNDVAQAHLRSMRLFLNSVVLFSMEPRNDLLTDRAEDEAYCLAEPGNQYAVFFSGNGDRSVVLDLSSAAEKLQRRWLDVAQSRWAQEDMLVDKHKCTLRLPGTGHWVVVLVSGEAVTK